MGSQARAGWALLGRGYKTTRWWDPLRRSLPGGEPARPGREGPSPPPATTPPSQGRPAELFHCHDWLLSEGVIIFTS